MTKSLSQEEFIEKSRTKHGSKYDYSKVAYKNNSTKVVITCPFHGDFPQVPKSHLKGAGCSLCGDKSSASIRKFKLEDILIAFRNKHGDIYDYSYVEYANDSTPVKILCQRHGQFLLPPNKHKQGRGCPKCGLEIMFNAQRKSQEEFIAQASKVHESYYDYSDVLYVNAKTPILIRCPEHGLFSQIPDSHLRGTDCPYCFPGGYRSSLSGYLYILQSEELTKIGITNKSPIIRSEQISKDSKRKFKVIDSFGFEDGCIPQTLERKLLKELRERFESPLEKFDGSTECFYIEDIRDVIALVNEFVEQIV